jgi:hypothetical protein
MSLEDGSVLFTMKYWALLNLWDADIIYSYVALSEEMEKRFFCILRPLKSGFMRD